MYLSPLLTFKPTDESHAEIDVNYIMSGGAVIGVSNQIKIRMTINVIMGNINGLYALILRNKNLQVAVKFLAELRADLNSLSQKLRLPQDYKLLMIETYKMKMKLHDLRNVLENIIVRSQVDVSMNQIIATRCRFVLKFLDKQDFLPLPKTTNLNEQFLGFKMVFKGSVCLHQMCLKSCLLETSYNISNPTSLDIQCRVLETQNLRSKLKLEKGSIVKIQVSTTSDEYEMSFPVIVSAFLQKAHGDVMVNKTHFKCLLQNFDLGDGVSSNVTIGATLDSLSTWKHMLFILSGRSNGNALFAQKLQTQIKTFLKENAEDVNNKIKNLKTLLNSTIEKFMESEKRKINSTKY